MSNISVVGAGYVGLVTAACFAELGHKVRLLEIDPEKLSALEHGLLPVNEPGLTEIWERNWEEGRLTVTDDYVQGLQGSEFAFITVGTPSASNGKPDLKWVRSAAKSIAEAASGPMIVVTKSTVPLGTSDIVSRILTRQGKYDFKVVSNPEFLREGLAVFDFMNPIRVVIGAADPKAAQAVANLYASMNSPTIFFDNRTSEMSKYASNVFLATRISFINEIALLCDAYGVDVTLVSKIAGMEPRCGEGYLSAGLGWGGSCLPKDIRGLIYMGKNQGVSIPLLRSVLEINQHQPHVAIGKLRQLTGSLDGKTIGILGLSFKPGSDDMREASSLSIIPLLKAEGCQVKAYDPLAMERAAKLLPEVTYCTDAYEVAKGSDALMLVTEWDEFKELDLGVLASLMNQAVLVDGRNFFDPDEMALAGFRYDCIGRPGRGKTTEAVLASEEKVGTYRNK
jgi:UDPglucose 6-dehydrogenase